MGGRLAEREHRRETGIGMLEQVAPLLPRARLENLPQRLLHLGPGLPLHLRLRQAVSGADLLQQQGIELRLHRADRDPFAIRAAIGVIEQIGRATRWERVWQYVSVSVVAVSLQKKKEKNR